jgi:hypothetical protein
VPAGDSSAYEFGMPAEISPLSAAQRTELTKLVQQARSICGFGFAVFIGPLLEGRDSAVAQHAQLRDAASAVLVAVDPTSRSIEIVTGVNTTAALDNRACEFAALSMKSCFVADDLVGGVREGVNLLAQHARRPAVLHLDEPA